MARMAPKSESEMSERELSANRVGYEWGMEGCEREHLDIIDNDYSEELTFFKERDRRVTRGRDELVYRLVLIRDVWSHADMVMDREWAYLSEDGTLPEYFDGGSKVPQRFHREFERNKDWASQYTV